MYNYSYDPDAIAAAIGTYMACFFFIAVAIVAFMVWLYWRILSKAGYNGAWALLVLVPFVGAFASFGILLVLAFGDWPALRSQGYAPPVVPPYQPPSQPVAPAAGPSAAPYQGYSGPAATPAPEPPAAVPVAPVTPPVAMPAPEAPAPEAADVEPPAPPVDTD